MAAELTGGSLDSRHDAISRDYRIAFSMGPWGVADLSRGVYARVWRVEATYDEAAASGEVLLQRATEDATGWEPAVSIFSYEGPPIKEVDLAFDQSGNTYVSADRDTGPDGESEVWMYWFNTLVGSFLFEEFSPGKTPRLLLDDPESDVDSDLLLFYLNDTNQRAEYRVQRELFANAYQVPVDQWYNIATGGSVLQSSTLNLFLEEVARSKDLRLHIIASQWEPISGTYKLLVTETAPYPYKSADSASTEHLLGEGTVIEYILDNESEEEFGTDNLLLNFVAFELITTLEIEEPERATAANLAQAVLTEELILVLNMTNTPMAAAALNTIQTASTTVVIFVVGPMIENVAQTTNVLNTLALVAL